MKRLFFCFLLSPVAVHAQWTVYDPAVHNQQIVSTAQEVAKFVEMIQHQVTQIEQLTTQVRTLQHYVDLFGDPAGIQVNVIPSLKVELTTPETGKLPTEMTTGVQGKAALAYHQDDLFPAVSPEFTTPGGAPVTRNEASYRPLGALQQTAENFRSVAVDTTRRRTALKAEIAQTLELLQKASTDAEVQKLSAALIGLGSALASTGEELSQATSSALVQDIAQRTEIQRQALAKREQQSAEFSEAVRAYGQTFRLWSAPVSFPQP